MKDTVFFSQLFQKIALFVNLVNKKLIGLSYGDSEFSTDERLVLGDLYRYGTSSTKIIAKSIIIAPANLRKAVIELSKKNYLRRIRSKIDQRIILIELTQNGCDKAKEYFEGCAALLEKNITKVLGNEFTSLKKSFVCFTDFTERYADYYCPFIRERKSIIKDLNFHDLLSRSGENLNNIYSYRHPNFSKSYLEKNSKNLGGFFRRNLITYLYENDTPIGISALGRLFNTNKKHISKILNSLESTGFIEKSQDDNDDLRVRTVKLSEKTRREISEGQPQHLKYIQDSFSAIFTDDELDTFEKICVEINNILSKL